MSARIQSVGSRLRQMSAFRLRAIGGASVTWTPLGAATPPSFGLRSGPSWQEDGSGSPVVDGAGIAAGVDVSEGGHNYSQSTEANRPIAKFINGRWTTRFGSGAMALLFDAPWAQTATWCAYARWTQRGDGNAFHMLMYRSSGAALYTRNDGAGPMTFTASGQLAQANPILNDQPAVIRYRGISNTSVACRTNRQADTIATVTGFTPGNWTRLGDTSFGQHPYGDLDELWVFPVAALNSEDDARMMTYLGLPATDPMMADLFGTSISFGSLATSWATLTDKSRLAFRTNYAVSGAQALDQAKVAYDAGRPTSYFSTCVELGANDQRTGGYGADAVLRGVYIKAVRALVLWRSLDVIQTAQSAATSGTWANTSPYGGLLGRNSSGSGATLTWTGVNGDTIYLGYTAQVGQTGTWRVLVDGVVKATGGTDMSQGTVNGLFFGPQAIRISGCGTGNHTVVFENTNGALVYCDWVAGIGNQSITRRVLVGNVMMPDFNVATVGVDAANVNAYNVDLEADISSLASDSLPIRLVGLRNRVSSYGADGFHPDNVGEQEMADTYDAEV